MMALMLALAAGAPPPPSLPVWRVVDRPGLHVGARPALLYTTDGPELAAGATVQVTTFFL
jgi:hypothetical protein